jgi:hypothetical protein
MAKKKPAKKAQKPSRKKKSAAKPYVNQIAARIVSKVTQ